MENCINTEKYFERINLVRGTAPADGQLLRELQYAHCTTVPYENIDIVAGKPIDLSAEALYEKIVINHRGGYCFEINGLFGKLLRELGYEVTDLFARYLRGSGGIPMRRHRVLKVSCADGTFLCDAGIGQSAPKEPLLLEEGLIQKQFGEVYRFERDEFLGWILCDFHKGEWRRFFSFTDEPQLDIDFEAASFWCEKHPDSPFTNSLSLSIKTRDGRITLDGDQFRIFAGDSVTERTVSGGELPEILAEYFGIIQ